MKFRLWSGAALAATLLLATTAADAAYVAMGKPARGELNHKQIFASVYGGSFRYAGANLTNGTITATRITDTNDATFAGGTYTARALAKYAGGTEDFGVVQNGRFQKLLTATSVRPTGAAAATANAVTFDGPVAFAQSSGRSAGYFATDAALNADKQDHAVTYKLTGLDFGGEVYVVFFENRAMSKSDRDYNDLVIQLNRAVTAPSPVAAALGASLLAAMTMQRRRR